MGFDKPKYSFDAKREPPKRASTFADTLFGGSEIQKPLNENIFESKLDRSLSYPNGSENNDVENTFGGYVPSMATNMQRQPKRNVKFVDDLFSNENSNERPKTSPGPASSLPTASQAQPTQSNSKTVNNDINSANSLTRSLPIGANSSKSNGYDWLGISDDLNDSWLKPREKSLQPAINKEPVQQPTQNSVNTNNNNKGSANDWLGIKDSQNSSFEKENFETDSRSKANSVNNGLINNNGTNTQKMNTSFEGSINDGNDQKVLNQVFIKAPSKTILNSSFTDSVENNANTSVHLASNNMLSINQNLNRTHESASESGSDIADAWLNNLMASKKPPKSEPIQSNRTKIVSL